MKHITLRRTLCALAALAFGVAGFASTATAQQTGVISAPFSLSVAGTGPSLTLNGQGICSITIYNGASFSLTAQTASDGPTSPQTWNTATSIGTSGVITSTGTFGGNIAASGTGNTNFRFVLTSLGTGPLTGVESCSPASGSGSGASQSVTVQNTPGVTVQNTPGVTVANTPGVTVQNTPAVTVANTPGVAAVQGSTTGAIVPHICDKWFNVSVASATTTALVAAVASKKVYLCEVGFISSGTNTTDTVQIEYGTQATTACDTGTTTYAFPVSANGLGVNTINRNTTVIIPAQTFALLFAPASNQVCVLTAGAAVSIVVYGWYAQDAN